jgi:hypothetical protein
MTSRSCTVCCYSLEGLAAAAPCPECGAPASDQTLPVWKRRVARRLLKVHCLAMIPGWCSFLLIAAGWASAYLVLGLPYGKFVDSSVSPLLNTLGDWAIRGLLGFLLSFLIGVVLLPVALFAQQRAWCDHAGERWKRYLFLCGVSLPVVVVAAQFAGARMVLFNWIPD